MADRLIGIMAHPIDPKQPFAARVDYITETPTGERGRGECAYPHELETLEEVLAWEVAASACAVLARGWQRRQAAKAVRHE